MWTGPTIRSLSIDMADIHRYKSLIGRWPMIWDNTLYARNKETKRYGGYTTYYPGKVRMCNLFEPYDTGRPKDFQKYNDGRQMYTNGNAYSEVYKVKYATVADFEWNTSAYNPELSLWKVLCNAYGPSGARQLILFNDAYYGAYEFCLRMEIEGLNEEYIVPSMMETDVFVNQAVAVGLKAIEQGIARRTLTEAELRASAEEKIHHAQEETKTLMSAEHIAPCPD